MLPILFIITYIQFWFFFQKVFRHYIFPNAVETQLDGHGNLENEHRSFKQMCECGAGDGCLEYHGSNLEKTNPLLLMICKK